ncbi:DUF397 domain-containing protein [Kitasatospora sp. NPDC006697]
MPNTIPDLSALKWIKSSHSGNGGANCVEVAPATGSRPPDHQLQNR